ncbi:methyltransferase type 11 [Paenibacillus ferrarius]|uniref:Methyltransferase type 11 n=1 Tax=Paenibacillus ferrarius TaxID=1469647 RepID=A0A1V4HKQ3_9BACL|nr:class I SAM-dependent methyltransferase [Paenibacillus ferrarius]OPH57569.1 methyltransferase type 11 [Paenibacillus ferrarius]
MSRETEIYQDNTHTYDELISKQPPLDKVINEIRPYYQLDVVDLGAGTGRFALFLVEQVNSLLCLDNAKPMLAVLEEKLSQTAYTNWQTMVSDHRELPIADNSKDLVLAGWTLCYLASSSLDNWEHNLEQMMAEMTRILRPDGTIIIFETLGTAVISPTKHDYLSSYYDLLESKYGFEHSFIRTDYAFHDLEEAVQLTSYFFGEEIAGRVAENGWHIVPEFAGIWVKHKGLEVKMD